jgi:hypothetical protein
MAGEEKPGRIDDAEYYALIRARLEHEDGLIVNRLSWLMASQSFLFTAYAIVLNGLSSATTRSILDHHGRLIRLIPVVGIASSALISTGIVAATRAMAWLRRQFRLRVPDEVALGLPPIQTPGPIAAAGLAAPLILPVAFVAVWLYLLVTRLR